jgi:hypothetical protein
VTKEKTNWAFCFDTLYLYPAKILRREMVCLRQSCQVGEGHPCTGLAYWGVNIKTGGCVVAPGQNGGGCPRIFGAEQSMLAGREGSQVCSGEGKQRLGCRV